MALLPLKHWDQPFLIDDEKLPLFDTGSVISIRGRPTVKRYLGGGRYDQRTLASFLMDRQAATGEHWTHVNGDTMDFRCENLQLERQGVGSRKQGVSDSNARRAAAQRATGKMVGVRKHGARYYARITDPDRTMRLLGSYATEEDAGRAYDKARAELGLPPVNFPGEGAEASGSKVD